MSEYVDITIQNLSLYTFRNYLENDIVKLMFSRKELNVTPNCLEDPDDPTSEKYTKYMYKTTIQNAKQRLDAQGFGISNFEKLFNDNIPNAIYYNAFLDFLKFDIDDYEEQSLLRSKKYVSFKKWKNSLNKIINFETKNGNINFFETSKEINISTECDKIIYHSLIEERQESFYGINTDVIPIGYIFRLILESCISSDEIILDFTNLGYWDEDCIPKAMAATDNTEKIIVLVEGTSDKDILEFALNRFYPHLADLFYFMDFDDEHGGKRDGGTTYLIKNLKAFYFSKIKTKFIAIFDNDAEGYQSKCTLLNDIQNWPDNFRILLYPQNKLFHTYPTIIPNGSIYNDDINKKACSIELYLPDSIIQSNEVYYPIEWESRKKIRNDTGKSEALYQGVISQKDEIKQIFHKMRKSIENNEQPFVAEDWIRLKQVLDTIVFAFS